MKHPICVIGLGYVGLPLAHAFAKKGFSVYGYDVHEQRVQELASGHDRTGEIEDSDLQSVSIEYSTDPSVIANGTIIIMAIPTPVDEKKKPDLSIVKAASKTVGKHMSKGAIVVYESTVYPGTTEEICAPILEQESGMTCGEDFTLGYSPERINPGDKEHTVDKIVKVVAGQDEKTLDTLCDLYSSVVSAGVYRASSIKVAEMAKAIENAQRDLNIAFVNEVAMLCHKIGITTEDVLEAAGTKWNFLPFKPGLVGGHCIGVDPYYLVEKAKMLGMKTHVITAGRAVNDTMGNLVVSEVIDDLGSSKGKKALVMGLTFKENIPDTRNSQSFAVIKALSDAGFTVLVDDPQVSDDEWERFDVTRGTLADGPFDAILLLVKHREYEELGEDVIINAVADKGVIYDLKSMLHADTVKESGRTYRAL